jgi:hypothetical protein
LGLKYSRAFEKFCHRYLNLESRRHLGDFFQLLLIPRQIILNIIKPEGLNGAKKLLLLLTLALSTIKVKT